MRVEIYGGRFANQDSARAAIDENSFVADREKRSAIAGFFWGAEMEAIPSRRAVLEFPVGAGVHLPPGLGLGVRCRCGSAPRRPRPPRPQRSEPRPHGENPRIHSGEERLSVLIKRRPSQCALARATSSGVCAANKNREHQQTSNPPGSPETPPTRSNHFCDAFI